VTDVSHRGGPGQEGLIGGGWQHDKAAGMEGWLAEKRRRTRASLGGGGGHQQTSGASRERRMVGIARSPYRATVRDVT
jgi:hypothetical protein